MRALPPRTAIPASLVLLAACVASKRSRAPAFEVGTPVAVSWEARVGAAGLEGEALPGPAEPRSARFVEVRCSIYRLDGRAGLSLPAHPAAWKVDGAGIARILGAGPKGSGAEPVSAPRLVLPDGGGGLISILDPRSFVGEFEARWEGGAWIADPVVRTVETGLRVEARPALLEGGAGVDLSLALTLADLVSPTARTEALLVASGAPVTVESPIVRVQRLSASATLALGERLLLACPDAARPGTRLLATFEAREAERVAAVEGAGASRSREGRRGPHDGGSPAAALAP